MFENIQTTLETLKEQKYITSQQVATVLFLGEKLNKPVLVEGPPGVGKTEVAKVVAQGLEKELIRLQCVEGIDQYAAIAEFNYGKQILFTQILRDQVNEIIQGYKTVSESVRALSKPEHNFFSEEFLIERPLLKAINSEERKVLLIDEIDRADVEFEAFLLEILSDYQISIPELGTVGAKTIPYVVLTSNNTRELSDALKRRCLHLFIDYPSVEVEREIIRLKVPEIGEKLADTVARIVNSIRKLDLKKKPSIGESLDWAQTLLIMLEDEGQVDEDVLKSTLGVLLKHEGDVKVASRNVASILE